jgi:chromate transporter
MKQIQLFFAFFRVGMLGYGGGPSSIPLVHKEVVEKYKWMNDDEFADVLALGNALPGPIATKMAGYIGYQQGGVLGALIGIFATVAPSLILMISLLGILYKFKDSPKVKRMTNYIRPTIAVLLGMMTFNFFFTSYEDTGIWQTLLLAAVSFLLIEKWKVHTAFVIVGSLVYGGIFLS